MKGSKNTNNARDWTDTETEAWMGLVKAQQLLSRNVEDELKKKGYPPLKDGSLRLNDLGKRVLFDKYNVTRIVQRLEEEGLVSRTQCPVDGRGIFACITDKGRMLRREMWPVYKETVKKSFFSKFNKKELKELKNFIERIQASGLEETI